MATSLLRHHPPGAQLPLPDTPGSTSPSVLTRAAQFASPPVLAACTVFVLLGAHSASRVSCRWLAYSTLQATLLVPVASWRSLARYDSALGFQMSRQQDSRTKLSRAATGLVRRHARGALVQRIPLKASCSRGPLFGYWCRTQPCGPGSSLVVSTTELIRIDVLQYTKFTADLASFLGASVDTTPYWSQWSDTVGRDVGTDLASYANTSWTTVRPFLDRLAANER